MITPDTGRTVTSRGVTAKGVFGISEADHAHIMTILRDTLYSDKVLAVLREYGANAWDAHRQAGKHALPIKVTLPTSLDPTLTIRDFGLGLSDEDVFRVYAMYGASTKRGTNEAVGFLGIGSKSGFSYSDSFTITSWYEGFKRIYVAVLDASEVGEIQRLSEEPCDAAEVGVEIQIPVKPNDVYEFQRKARNLYRFFDPQPEINLDLPKPDKHVTEHGYVVTNNAEHGWTAIMGCVPYRLDPQQVQRELTEIGLWDTVQRLHGGLYFKIGEVQISASREELKYSDLTKRAIVQRFEAMIEGYVNDVLACLAKDDMTPWAKRLKGTFMATTLNAPIPERYREWSRVGVPLFGDKSANTEPPTKFTLLRRGSGQTDKVTVHESARLVLQDDTREIGGFALGNEDVVVQPVNGYAQDLPAVEGELAIYLEGASLTGIPLTRLSTYSWHEPYREPKYNKRGRRIQPVNPKHKVRSFRLLASAYHHYPWSKGWEIVQREPTDNDVFVILSSFEVIGDSGRSFYDRYSKDVGLAKWLKAEMPEVYGYKSTEEKPVAKTDCKGTHYAEWRRDFFRKLLTREQRELLTHRQWLKAFDGEHRSHSLKEHATTIVERLKTSLGEEHPITTVFLRYVEARKAWDSHPKYERENLVAVAEAAKLSEVDVAATMESLYATYRLLKVVDDGFYGFATDPAEWIEYVKLVDLAAQVSPVPSKESDDEIIGTKTAEEASAS